MAYETVQVKKLTGGCGAEVLGVDLKTMSNRQWDEVQHAFAEHGVVFFRDQKLTPEQHIEFARRWAPIDVNRFFTAVKGYPEIAEVRKEPAQKTNIGGGWHTDHSYDPEPAMGSILLARELPEEGGDTLFANMYRAYETLSPPIKQMLQGLTALHDSSKAHYYRVKATDRDDIKFPNAEHPVVRTHPVTGRQGLYVNRGFTLRIPQLRRNESDALLEMLYRHIETPEFQCRFRWQKNSVAFWDNRCAQHHAMFDYFPHRRYGHRVTVCGDKPFYRAT
jgi:taurine dioxygenase